MRLNLEFDPFFANMSIKKVTAGDQWTPIGLDICISVRKCLSRLKKVRSF